MHAPRLQWLTAGRVRAQPTNDPPTSPPPPALAELGYGGGVCDCSQYRGAFAFSALGALQVDSILYGCPACTVSLAAPYEGILVSGLTPSPYVQDSVGRRAPWRSEPMV